MRSQWECFLQNLGVWDGSFTGFSPEGILLQDTPTVVVFEGRNNNQMIYQSVERFPPGEAAPKKLELEYTSIDRYLVFFDNGDFCRGGAYYSAFGVFGSEFGFIDRERRLRFVILYDRDRLDKITLIREYLRDSKQPERPLLTVDQLLGTWSGEIVTHYADGRERQQSTSTLSITREGDRICQTIESKGISFQSTGILQGNTIDFTEGTQPVRVLLLPDGGSIAAPVTIESGKPFFLEVGWLRSETERSRLIRHYDDRGSWTAASWIRERKQ
ncbi:DUF3598 family protein [Roseofilum casamattae]|uniref:DUF3598 family protein n=1 Tax=Roseofilum casamattae BLCC-M143 TaxID=3022442 RepID=A0ABT7BWL8_9CYAN|nr:DUF3598 family protein [Roseofilum casamattae]MDJ1182856.1 DUF3598 family protein [Roseofilum casamattae BLCC-M143]